jgi:DNA modification methylase
MAAKSRKAKAAVPLPALLVAPEAWVAYSVEPRPTASLLPYARNAKTHSAKQVREIAALIAEFGWTMPVIVDERDEIIAGHGRVLAANLLGLAEVPVGVALGWSDAKKRRYRIADNKVAENSGWDKELLALELAALANMPDGGTFAGLGFSDAEVLRLLPEVAREGHTDFDAEAPPALDAATAVSRPGDIWLLGDHRLMCGDATNADHVSALLGIRKPHLMVTDPPYGVDYDPDWRNRSVAGGGDHGGAGRAVGLVENDDRADWRAAWALFPGEVVYVWHAATKGPEVCTSLEAVGFERRAQIVWNKNKHVISRGHYHWRHESCWYMVRAGGTGHWQGSRSEMSVWDIANNAGPDGKKQDVITGHGTQKPIECMLRPIKNNSKPGDYVYEPFSGSGTTIIAGEMMGRRVLAMELMPAYVDVAVRRWEGFTQKSAVLAAGERPWREVAAERAAEMQAA